MNVRLQQAASRRLDEIYRHSLETWGEAQADRYIRQMFTRFDMIAQRQTPWRPIPAEFGVNGYVCREGRHYIYWRVLGDGAIGIVTILHDRMHQIARFREDWESTDREP